VTEADTIEALLEAMFSVESAPRLYKEDQIPLAILSLERMLHKDYDLMGSATKRILVMSLKRLGAKTN
jgi:hypothetical protein